MKGGADVYSGKLRVLASKIGDISSNAQLLLAKIGEQQLEIVQKQKFRGKDAKWKIPIKALLEVLGHHNCESGAVPQQQAEEHRCWS